MLSFLVFLLVSLIGVIVCGRNDNLTIMGGVSTDLTPKQYTVAQDYAKYKLPRVRPTFEEFCFPKSFRVQPQQAFAGDYMSPRHIRGHKSLLVFHKIGAGKTCVSIQIAQQWRHDPHAKPLFIMPASLIPGFRNEARSQCAGNDFMTAEMRESLRRAAPGSREYADIITQSDKLIDRAYHIYSYNSFATAPHIATPSVIIIDEVQNINNPKGAFYGMIVKYIEKHAEIPVVIMSGTPIFDNPREILGLLRLMRISTSSEAIPTPAELRKLIDGHVTYFEGAPSYTFPRVTVRIKVCPMSQFQTKWYLSEVENEMRNESLRAHEIANDFYIKSRQRSNIVFPRGLAGEDGLAALTPTLIRDNLATYSSKFAQLMRYLLRGALSFVYSSFTGPGGIESLVKCLRVFGYKDFAQHGPGPRRFAVWSGDESSKTKDIIRATFNSAANNDASQIQVIIGSPAMKEGVSLFRVAVVYVLEMYWNHSRLAQIYGRAVRYCSHKTLAAKFRHVDIYIFAAVIHKDAAHYRAKCGADLYHRPKATPQQSIDLYMLDIADAKKEGCAPIVGALIDSAVDRVLFQ
jgi:SNF2-related domain